MARTGTAHVPCLHVRGFSGDRNMSAGMFSVGKEKPRLVVAWSFHQFFLTFEDEAPYQQSKSK